MIFNIVRRNSYFKITIKNNYYWIILACCCALTGTIHGIEGGTSGVFFLPVSKTLGTSISAVSVYVTIKGLVMVLTTPIANRIIQNYKLKTVLSIATIFYIISLIMIAKMNSISILYVAAIIMGICSAFLSTVIVPVLISNWFKRKQGLMLGIAFGFSGITGAITGPIVAQTVNHLGWRNGYILIALIISVILLPLMLVFVKKSPEEVGLMAYGERRKISEAQDKPRKIDKELLKRHFRSRAFIYTILFGMTLALSNGILFNLASYVEEIGFTAMKGSLITSLALIGATIGKVILGHANDFFKSDKIVLIGVLTGGIGILFLFWIKDSLITLSIGAFLYGFIVCLMTLQPPIVIREIFREDLFSNTLVYVNMAAQFCYALGPTIFALIYDMSGTYTISFILCIIFTCISYPLCYKSMRSDATA